MRLNFLIVERLSLKSQVISDIEEMRHLMSISCHSLFCAGLSRRMVLLTIDYQGAQSIRQKIFPEIL